MFPKLVGDIISPNYFEEQAAQAEAERLAAEAAESSDSSQPDSKEESA
ncbi:hypothetical protein [Bradymonas sediminis]|nr:hypothetical protein [Bradymonas sediminis]